MPLHQTFVVRKCTKKLLFCSLKTAAASHSQQKPHGRLLYFRIDKGIG